MAKLDNHFPCEMRLHIGGSSGLFLLLPKVQLLYINVCVCCALCCITSSRHPLGLENVFCSFFTKTEQGQALPRHFDGKIWSQRQYSILVMIFYLYLFLGRPVYLCEQKLSPIWKCKCNSIHISYGNDKIGPISSCIMQTYKMFKHLFGNWNCFRIWIVQAAVSCKRCVVKAAMMQCVAIFVAGTYLLVFRTISSPTRQPSLYSCACSHCSTMIVVTWYFAIG